MRLDRLIAHALGNGRGEHFSRIKRKAPVQLTEARRRPGSPNPLGGYCMRACRWRSTTNFALASVTIRLQTGAYETT